MSAPRWREPYSALIFHKPDSAAYAKEDSRFGVKWAHVCGANATDIDINVTKDGYIVGTHWPHPFIQGGFKIPKGMHRGMKISQMTLAQVKTLRHKQGYRIFELAELLLVARSLGMTLFLEQKGDPRLADPEIWKRYKAYADSIGVEFHVMSLPRMAHAVAVLEAAGYAGIRTGVLARGKVRPQFYSVSGVTWIKNAAVQNRRTKPADVVQLGPGALHGSSVGTSRRANAARRRVLKRRGRQL